MPEYYLALYPDLQAAFKDDIFRATRHYAEHGIREGRSPNPFFDPRYYAARYPDLAAHSFPQLLEHWTRHGIGEGRQGSELFDAAFYLRTNPDVAAVYGAGNHAGAIEHWLRHGSSEGRLGAPPEALRNDQDIQLRVANVDGAPTLTVSFLSNVRTVIRVAKIAEKWASRIALAAEVRDLLIRADKAIEIDPRAIVRDYNEKRQDYWHDRATESDSFRGLHPDRQEEIINYEFGPRNTTYDGE